MAPFLAVHIPGFLLLPALCNMVSHLFCPPVGLPVRVTLQMAMLSLSLPVISIIAAANDYLHQQVHLMPEAAAAGQR